MYVYVYIYIATIVTSRTYVMLLCACHFHWNTKFWTRKEGKKETKASSSRKFVRGLSDRAPGSSHPSN